MLNVYDGTLGIVFNHRKDEKGREYLIKTLRDLIATVNGSLSHNVIENGTKVVILTNYYQEENLVPYFSHPIIFNSTLGERTIAVDLRPFVKSNVDEYSDVRNMLRDTYNGELQLMRFIFNKKMCDSDYTFLSTFKDFLIKSFKLLIARYIKELTYEVDKISWVEVLGELHYTTMDLDKDSMPLDEALEYLTYPTLQRLKDGDLKLLYKELTEAYQKEELILPSKLAGDLLNNVGAVLPSGRARSLNLEALVQKLSRGYISFNSNEMAVAYLEHKPTQVSLYYQALTSVVNSKKTFKIMLQQIHRKDDVKEYIKGIREFYEEEFSNF